MTEQAYFICELSFHVLLFNQEQICDSRLTLERFLGVRQDPQHYFFDFSTRRHIVFGAISLLIVSHMTMDIHHIKLRTKALRLEN